MSEATVLIVDDEEDYRDIMAERLESRGFQVDKAQNGIEALDKIDHAGYDAIVLDFMMPGLDGLETLKRIRARKPDLQVILLTGHATVQSGVDAIKMGALDLLEKPAEIERLVEIIQAAKEKRVLITEKKHKDFVMDALHKYGM